MRCWLNIGTLILFSNAAGASELNNIVSVRLQDVTFKILENNPALKTNDYEAQAAVARIRQALQKQPLKIKLEMGNFARSEHYYSG